MTKSFIAIDKHLIDKKKNGLKRTKKKRKTGKIQMPIAIVG